jgi:beta-mannanase
MSAVAKFEEAAGKKVSMVNFFQPFANCNPSCSFYSFPSGPMENIRTHGSIPVLSWSSQSIPSSKSEPDFQLSDVISGRYDSYIREFATKAKAWGHPFMLRFDWEMNGKWFPWHEGVNGNQPGEFVTAWRHVHDIFSEVGAGNVTWVWCPNVEYSGSTPFSEVYPGDAYVDWTGLDGYNRGTNPAAPEGWKTFSQVYRSSYNALAGSIAPSKPLLVGEVASSEDGGSKAAWIKDMLTRVPTEYPKIRALLYFDKYDSSMDWPLETSSSALSAFAEGVQSSTYVTNTFSNLSATKILPLG